MKESLPQNHREMAAYLKERGFTEQRSAKHGTIWGDRYGNTVLIAGSPSDRRSWQNSVADINRCVAMRPAPPPEVPLRMPAGHPTRMKSPGWIPIAAEPAPLKATLGSIALKSAAPPEREPERKIIQAPRVEVGNSYGVLKEQPKEKPVHPNTPKAGSYQDKALQAKVFARIKELLEGGVRPPHVGAILAAEGMFRPDGSEIDGAYVRQLKAKQGWTMEVKLGRLPKSPLQKKLTATSSPGKTTAHLAELSANIEKAKLPIVQVSKTQYLVGAAAVEHKKNNPPSTPEPAPPPSPPPIAPVIPHPAKPQPKPQPGFLPAAVTAILTDPHLPDIKKAHMIANYCRVAKGKVPDIVSSLISDPQLTDEERVAMLMGYVEV